MLIQRPCNAPLLWQCFHWANLGIRSMAVSICMSADSTTRLAPNGNNKDDIWVSTRTTMLEKLGSSTSPTPSRSTGRLVTCAMSADGVKVLVNDSLNGLGQCHYFDRENQKGSWHGVAMSSDGTKMVAVQKGDKIRLSSRQSWNLAGVHQHRVKYWSALTMSADGSKIMVRTPALPTRIWKGCDVSWWRKMVALQMITGDYWR